MELRARFRARARERLDALEALVPRLLADDVPTETLREARRLAHELAGGAGSFGFPELGQEAAVLEALLRTLPERPSAAEELPRALARVRARLPDEAPARSCPEVGVVGPTGGVRSETAAGA